MLPEILSSKKDITKGFMDTTNIHEAWAISYSQRH
ncbi:hypothetical protein JOC69_001133 [Heliobacterium gestii]|nr:hypothetical protein [Heliomicrobium gestii]